MDCEGRVRRTRTVYDTFLESYIEVVEFGVCKQKKGKNYLKIGEELGKALHKK